jgi:stage II sporulation protein D
VQAVAARTYAITTDAGGPVFDQYDDTRSQMYGGIAAETASTDAAVAATSGQIVTYHGAPVATYFFSSSGGYTENVENVWGGSPEPWLRGVPDPYDGAAGNPYHAWGQDLSIGAAAAKLGHLVKGAFEGIAVTRQGVSGRVISGQVIGTGGRTRVTGSELASSFGLLSTNATFTTITTDVGTAASKVTGIPVSAGPVAASGSGSGGAAAARDLKAMGAQFEAFVASIRPQLSGQVIPGPPGAAFSVQLRKGGRWQTVAHGHLDSAGAYAVVVARTGTYRVLYHGLAGPTVVAS